VGSNTSLFCFQIKEQKQHCVVHTCNWRVKAFKTDREVVDHTVYRMICKRVVSQLNNQFCSSLIFIFSIIWTLGYPDYFPYSQQVRMIEVGLYSTTSTNNFFIKQKKCQLLSIILITWRQVQLNLWLQPPVMGNQFSKTQKVPKSNHYIWNLL